MLNAYDDPMALTLEVAVTDVILVGDSLDYGGAWLRKYLADHYGSYDPPSPSGARLRHRSS